MANDHGVGIFIPMEDAGFTLITDKDFCKEILKKNPNAAVVNPDILEGASNENEGSYEPDVR